MRKSNIKLKLPKQCLRFMLICIVGLLVIAGVGLYPGLKQLRELEVKATELEYDVKKQRALLPFYLQLAALDSVELPKELQSSDEHKLRRGEISEVMSALGEMALDNKLDLISATPKVRSLEDDSRHLVVTIEAKGRFSDFHGFMLDLGKMGSLERIEQVNIHEGGDRNELKVVAWLAASLESSGGEKQ